jgi:hypothetical protein
MLQGELGGPNYGWSVVVVPRKQNLGPSLHLFPGSTHLFIELTLIDLLSVHLCVGAKVPEMSKTCPQSIRGHRLHCVLSAQVDGGSQAMGTKRGM